MAQQQKFRSALNGFNREDVVRYIEYINAKHTAQINQLTSEAEFLRTRQEADSAAAEQLAEARAQCEELEKRCFELEDLLTAQNTASDRQAELEARCADLEQQLSALTAEKAQLERERDTALRQQNSLQCRVEQELEAYRRAERTERLARERAEQMYRQVNGVISDATVKVDAAAEQLGDMTDKVMSQLQQLQCAISGSKQALRDAAATLYTIRPEGTEEN